MRNKSLLNLSDGNPLFAMRSVLNRAFRAAAHAPHTYHFMNGAHSEEKIARALSGIQKYFNSRGFHTGSFEGVSLSDVHVTGGGTTQGFASILRMLAKDVAEANKHSMRKNAPIVPAILMPIPTYGFFAQAVVAAGFKIVPIERSLRDGGVLDRSTIIDTIHAARKKDLRIVGYYDSNPNNPLGLVRGHEETKMIGDIMLALSDLQRQDDQQLLNTHLAKVPDMDLGGFKMKPGGGYSWRGPASRVRFIDDMVYDGLEYGEKKPVGFANFIEFSPDTLTLAGLSKIGLASLRAGVILAGRDDTGYLKHQLLLEQYSPSMPALMGLEAYFNVGAAASKQRLFHLKRLNEAHRHHGLLMKALINGIDTMPEVTPLDRRKLEKNVMDHKSCNRDTARDILRNSRVPGAHILTTPEAGFFHLIDFSALRGRSYSNYLTMSKRYDGNTVMSEETGLHDILRTQDLAMASGAWNELDLQAMVGRVSFAIPKAKIFESVDRLRRSIENLNPVTAEKPSPAMFP